MSLAPKITFIICTYNRSTYLRDSLQSLRDCKPINHETEILVVDNNSSDDTYLIVQQQQKQNKNSKLIISYIKEEQQGLSFARNRGIKEAQSDFLVFVDDDIKASTGFINSWQIFSQQNPYVLAAGGKIHIQFDAEKPGWISHYILSLYGLHDLGDRIKQYPKNWYPFGGNMAFNKKIFDKVGLFNTSLGRKGKNLAANEEKELFRRYRQHFQDIYFVPDALLYHRISQERMTSEFIRKQALGLGKSYKIEIANKVITPFSFYILQIMKSLITIVFLLFYSLIFTPSKGVMLAKFRYWIWKGYFS